MTFSKCSNLRTDIRSKIVELLDERNIQHSSVDLIRFSWTEENRDDGEDEDDGEDNEDGWEDEKGGDIEIKIAPYMTVITTPVTIWVGVLPDTLTGEVAFNSSSDILKLLGEHGITYVDVAYRKSMVKSLSGARLLAPVDNDDHLKAVVDPVTTALGLSIAGLKTLDNQGTMCFYFRVAQDLYAVTARHVLFPEGEGNNLYSYVGTFFPREDERSLTTPKNPGLRRRSFSWVPELSTTSSPPPLHISTL